MTLRFDLLVNQGETYRKAIPLTDTGTSQPLDITGWTVLGQIRVSHASGTVLHTLSLTPDGTDLVVEIPDTASAAWTFRLARYDVRVVAPNTDTTRLVEGAVVVKPQVSRA